MKKINIAEILRNCPKGTLLYATVYGEVKLSRIISSGNYPIEVEHNWGLDLFTEDGRMYPNKGECVLFPSIDQRDWSKFQRSFKDGDIVVNQRGKPFILKSYDLLKNNVCSYCGIDCCDNFRLSSEDWTFARYVRYATEEEKQKLFDSIKANGYKWNAETKTLDKLIEPKFKVGDTLQNKKNGKQITITKIHQDCYECDDRYALTFVNQDNWELVPNKFDISTLVPFESRVLVRNCKDQYWIPAYWGYKAKYGYVTTFGPSNYCIPYEGNEHLLMTKDDCSDYYKNW